MAAMVAEPFIVQPEARTAPWARERFLSGIIRSGSTFSSVPRPVQSGQAP